MEVQSVAPKLVLGEDGIWYSGDTEGVSYPSDGHEACFSVEEGSFWFKHRNRCILAAVKGYPPEDGGMIVDIGGGNGFVSLALREAGFEVALVEPGQTGARNARRRGLETVICATTESAQFRLGSLSAVGLFDVIEHIEDDVSFLSSIHQLVKQGGYLYATVPAHELLWSREDVVAGHYRRYSRKSLSKVLGQAGFTVELVTHLFRPLPIPISLFRVLPYRMGLAHSRDKRQKIARDHAVQGGVMSRVLQAALDSEVQNLENKTAMRFGSSCLVVAR